MVVDRSMANSTKPTRPTTKTVFYRGLPRGMGSQPCLSAVRAWRSVHQHAAGFPIAPLLFNADEVASGSINHAIRFILPNPRIRAHVYVHPATHAGGSDRSGFRSALWRTFRLKASNDLSQLMPEAQVVARAMQKYGMFLSDGAISPSPHRATRNKSKVRRRRFRFPLFVGTEGNRL